MLRKSRDSDRNKLHEQETTYKMIFKIDCNNNCNYSSIMLQHERRIVRMASKKTLKQILDESTKCFLVPCVYDCASNHAVEMCGFPVSLLSGGEVSISYNGVIDYGFTNLTDLEHVVARVSQTSSIPLIADIEDMHTFSNLDMVTGTVKWTIRCKCSLSCNNLLNEFLMK